MVWVWSSLPHLASTAGEIDDEKDAAEEFFSGLKKYAEQIVSAKQKSITSVCLYGNAAREIVKYAENNSIDLI